MHSKEDFYQFPQLYNLHFLKWFRGIVVHQHKASYFEAPERKPLGNWLIIPMHPCIYDISKHLYVKFKGNKKCMFVHHTIFYKLHLQTNTPRFLSSNCLLSSHPSLTSGKCKSNLQKLTSEFPRTKWIKRSICGRYIPQKPCVAHHMLYTHAHSIKWLYDCLRSQHQHTRTHMCARTQSELSICFIRSIIKRESHTRIQHCIKMSRLANKRSITHVKLGY